MKIDTPAKFRSLVAGAVPVERIVYETEFYSGGYKCIHIYFLYHACCYVYVSYRAGMVEVKADVRIPGIPLPPFASRISEALSYAADVVKAIAKENV